MREVVVGGVVATIIGEDQVDLGFEVTLVVLAHGRTRSKEDSIKFANIICKQVPNVIGVTWDLPNHGSRIVDPEKNSVWKHGNAFHLLQVQAIIDQGSTEALDLLEMVPLQLPKLNITKRVMLGVSLGGYITWNVVSWEPKNLTAAIPIITSPDTIGVFEQRWKDYKQENPYTAEEIEPLAFNEEVVKRMRANSERIANTNRLPLPILAICGGDDPLVPSKFSTRWGESALPQHRVEIVPGVKHEVVREMLDLTVEYLLSITTRV